MRISDGMLLQLDVLTAMFPDLGPHKWGQVYRGRGNDDSILISVDAVDDPKMVFCTNLHFPLVSNNGLNVMAMAYEYLPAMIQEIREWRLSTAPFDGKDEKAND